MCVCLCVCVCVNVLQHHINFIYITYLLTMYLSILHVFSTAVLGVLKYAICAIVYCDVGNV